MFIGHYATGLGFYIKEKGSKASLFLLALGTQFMDVLWGLFTIIGIEGGMSGGNVKYNFFDVPWTHSLLMAIVWSVLYGIASQYYMLKKYQVSNFGIWAGFSVFSHFILDFIVHNHDMRYTPFSDKTVPSLYLWKYPYLSFLVEFIIIVGCWYYYWMNSKDEFQTSQKPLIMLGFLVLVDVIGFLPSLSDTQASEVKPAMGIFTMIGLILIPLIMVYLHPINKSSS